MTDLSPSGPISRSVFAVSVQPGLRPLLPSVARGRAIVIDSSRINQCGTWVGSLTADWRPANPGPDFVELESIDGVRVFANRKLVGLLGAAGASVGRGGLPFRRGLSIELERPEMWIDYLERPASFPEQGASGEPSDRPPLT